MTRILLILIWTAGSISTAWAHAFLDHAEPRVGSTGTAPTQVEIWMTMDLEKAPSTLKVFDAHGVEVDNKDVRVSEATMTVSVPKLAAGTYTVIWKAVAVCTHHTAGTFIFTVK